MQQINKSGSSLSKDYMQLQHNYSIVNVERDNGNVAIIIINE